MTWSKDIDKAQPKHFESTTQVKQVFAKHRFMYFQWLNKRFFFSHSLTPIWKSWLSLRYPRQKCICICLFYSLSLSLCGLSLQYPPSGTASRSQEKEITLLCAKEESHPWWVWWGIIISSYHLIILLSHHPIIVSSHHLIILYLINLPCYLVASLCTENPSLMSVNWYEKQLYGIQDKNMQLHHNSDPKLKLQHQQYFATYQGVKMYR